MAEAGRRVLRITLTPLRRQAGDAAVSRALAPIRDALDEVPEGYPGVSSPGVNRPLPPEAFGAFAASAQAALDREADGGQTLSGVLGDLQDDLLTVETTVGPKQVRLDQIARARCTATWTR